MLVQGGVKAGKISKPYGLQGEVHLILNPGVAKHIEIGNPLFIDIDGQRVPFFIKAANLVSKDQAIVKFEFIHSIEDARKVCNCDVYLDPSARAELPRETTDLSKVIDYQAFDKNIGSLGKVTGYIPDHRNPVWLIEFGKKEIMVPAVAEFIQKIDHPNQSLYLDLPEGITDL
jgi:16S rRNA processing protein RimM